MPGPIGGLISNVVGGVGSILDHAFHDGGSSAASGTTNGSGQQGASGADGPDGGSTNPGSTDAPDNGGGSNGGPNDAPDGGRRTGGENPAFNGRSHAFHDDGVKGGGPDGTPKGGGPSGAEGTPKGESGDPGGPGANGGPQTGARPGSPPGPGGQNGNQGGPGGNNNFTGTPNLGANSNFGAGSNGSGVNVGGTQGGLLGGVGSFVTSLFGGGSIVSSFNAPSPLGGGNVQSQSSPSSFFSDDVPRFIGDTARQVANDVVPQRSGDAGNRNASLVDQQSSSAATLQRSTADAQTSTLRSDAGRPGTLLSSQPQQAPQTREQAATSGAALANQAEPAQVVPQGALPANAAVQEAEEELLLLAGMNGALVDADGEEKQATANNGKAAVATAEEMALLAKALAQANANVLAKTEGKEAVLQQGFANATSDPDGPDARTTQQLTDGRRASEMLDRALAKTAVDVPTQRATQEAKIIDPRTLQAQTRAEAADAKALREAGDKGRLASLAESGRNGIGENARRALAAAANGRARSQGAAESMRQALDWIGQQIRGTRFEDADSNAEGVHAMRVVAGLIVAGVVIAVVIGVLYALDLGFAG